MHKFSCDTCLSNSRSCSFIFAGIKTVLVGLLAQKAEVKFDKKRITSDEIIHHVKELGFGCDLMDKVGQGESTVDITVSVIALFTDHTCHVTLSLSCKNFCVLLSRPKYYLKTSFQCLTT